MLRIIAVVALLFVLVSSTTTSHHQLSLQSLQGGLLDQAVVQNYTIRPDPHLLTAKNYKSLVTVPATKQFKAHPHMRPQKRKMHEFISGPRISKKPKSFLAPSSYRSTTLSDKYFSTALPPLASHTNYDARAKQPSKLRISHFPSSITNHIPVTTHNVDVANAWYAEWQTEPEEFGPAIPLSLLTQPAGINLTNHAYDAERVHLNHWDCDHEPDGTVAQRLALQRKREERRRYTPLKTARREEVRRGVRQAAQTALVVDLTGDGTMEDTGVWDYPRCEYGGNCPPWRGNELQQKRSFAIPNHEEMLSYLSLYPPAKYPRYGTSYSQDAYMQRRG